MKLHTSFDDEPFSGRRQSGGVPWIIPDKVMKAAGLCCRQLSAPGLALVVVLSLASFAVAADWPQYRGANHDGISTDRLNKQWTGAVTNPLWRLVVPNSLSSLTVSGGRVFTQTRRFVGGEDKDVCVALDASTGVELWSRPVDDAGYPESGVGYDDGPRSTPVVHDGSVFVLSSSNKLWRLNAANGAVIWSKDLVALYGSQVIPWQNAASPVIENSLIYVNVSCSEQTLFALRASDGEPEWRSQNEAMTHSTPVLATIHGVRQVIFTTQSGLVALDPVTGTRLWKFNHPFPYGTSIAVSPVVHQDMVFICGSQLYNMGSVTVRVSFSNDVWTATQLWANTGFSSTLASVWMTPVAHEGFLYGQFGSQSFESVNAQLKCVEMRTGVVKWSVNGFGRGATLLVDNHLVSLTERGALVLVRPNTNAYTELARFTAIPNYFGDTNKCWNAPAVCDGKLFVRSTAYVAAFDLSVPALITGSPQFSASGFQFSVRTANGAPIDSNRFAGLQVRASTNPAVPLPQWTVLTHNPVLTGGVVRVGPIATGGQPQRFFIVSEP